jgi:hypothetical protein
MFLQNFGEYEMDEPVKIDAEAEAEAARLKAKAKARKKTKFSTSKLDKWKPELLSLRAEGVTLEELQIFLSEKKISCCVSTISRWMKKNG